MIEIELLFYLFLLMERDVNVIKEFLKAGVDINTKTYWGETTIMFASYYNKIEVIELLIQNGANINERSPGGWTALTFAIERDNRDSIQLLRKYGAIL